MHLLYRMMLNCIMLFYIALCVFHGVLCSIMLMCCYVVVKQMLCCVIFSNCFMNLNIYSNVSPLVSVLILLKTAPCCGAISDSILHHWRKAKPKATEDRAWFLGVKVSGFFVPNGCDTNGMYSNVLIYYDTYLWIIDGFEFQTLCVFLINHWLLSSYFVRLKCQTFSWNKPV